MINITNLFFSIGNILNCLSEQRSSSDDEVSVIDESMGPDHLTKD